MRGATSPRLQLELICARVLLPGADSQAERGLAARVDRLERRFQIASEGAAAPPPAAREPTEPVRTTAPPVQAAPPVPAEAEAVAPSAEPPSAGQLDTASVRQAWGDVLERVKSTRKVTWLMLFDKVEVLGADGRSLTLGFPDAGSVKGFTSGGHDEVVRQALIDVLGVDWRVEPVHRPGAQPPPSRPEAVAEPARPAGAPAPEPTAPGPVAEVHDADDGADVDDEATGADLVMRELGGRVIGEQLRGDAGS
jgi:DNA polymerase III subunit gamma/tau